MNQPQGVPIIHLVSPNQEMSGPSREENNPPARVIIGLKFLQHQAMKHAPQVAMNGVNIEVVRSSEPTKAEVLAENHCYDMFNNYFRGQLEPDEQETYRRKANVDKDFEGILMNCPVCVKTGKPHPKCRTCHGFGTVITYPIMPELGGQQ